MRLRVGFVLCLFAILTAVGCRKALAPNVDRNKAPETWITGAPFDTVTLIKGVRPPVGTIPIRFHVYWAGSDQDGAVVGYYWAVTDTTPGLSALPGPRPRDYHYTTRTDTTFIFEVAEDIPDRLHRFYIYAVDDQGKPDPTPARFVFNALDRFPPLPVFDEAHAVGTTYFFDNGVLKSEVRDFPIRDTVNNLNVVPPGDTVPSGSRLEFRFHGELTVAGSSIRGFRYKLDEPSLQPSQPESLYHKNVVEYHVPPGEADPERNGGDVTTVAPGTKVFTLRAVDQAGGSRDGTRRFQYNFSPDTWWAGPDPTAPGAPWITNSMGEKYILYVQGQLPAGGVPGTLLSTDSTQILPADRKPNRTFLEVWKDTLFLRREGDTVHLGSWVILHNGGFDKDSPYAVKVADGIQLIQPSFPGGPVLTPLKVANGSPIGFRSLITNWLYPNGPLAFSAQSPLYPFFDPNDVFNFQRIGTYHPMNGAGTAYALVRAEDGDGARDGRVGDARQLVEFPKDAREVSLRPLVMVWNVDFPPVLRTSDPSFRPRTTVVDTFLSTGWNLTLPADDRDPWISGDPVGGPSGTQTLRIRITITGKDTAGTTLVFADGVKYIGQPDILFNVPCQLGTGAVTLTVELCDCAVCTDSYAGEGRCITKDIRVYYKRPTSASQGCGPAGGPGVLGSSLSRGERR
jgi:hypothetical protein